MTTPARSLGARVLLVGAALGAVLASKAAFAQAAPPAAHQDAAFDVMNLLAHHGLHDIDDESWNAYGQFTLIGSYKPPFHAGYTNAGQAPLKPGQPPTGMSLLPDSEGSFTASFTLFFGLRLWKGAEGYLVPEVIGERP
ncbi:MAG TPA: hypothetical protein VFE48_11380, partial [Methylomirabilota bacterium]|nr:hypothetical protein [Methylomirabilota bacterium]